MDILQNLYRLRELRNRSKNAQIAYESKSRQIEQKTHSKKQKKLEKKIKNIIEGRFGIFKVLHAFLFLILLFIFFICVANDGKNLSDAIIVCSIVLIIKFISMSVLSTAIATILWYLFFGLLFQKLDYDFSVSLIVSVIFAIICSLIFRFINKKILRKKCKSSLKKLEIKLKEIRKKDYNNFANTSEGIEDLKNKCMLYDEWNKKYSLFNENNFLRSEVCYLDAIIDKIERHRADTVKEALQLIDRENQSNRHAADMKRALDAQTAAIKDIKLNINYSESNTFTQNNDIKIY